jgi:hypothetical protein
MAHKNRNRLLKELNFPHRCDRYVQRVTKRKIVSGRVPGAGVKKVPGLVGFG